MRYLTERDHTTLQQLVRREVATEQRKRRERPTVFTFLGVPTETIASKASGLVDICKGVPPTFSHGNQGPNLISNTTAAQWFWTTNKRARWTTTTGDIPDQLLAWNLTDCDMEADVEVEISRTIARESGGFWFLRPIICQGVAVEKWINGTADSVIDFGDTSKTITVSRGDETAASQQTVQYILHDGGTISTGKRVTARWWASENAYVIHLADCE